MRRFFVLLLCLLSFSCGLKAQRITDASFRTVAHIKDDGTVQDASFRTALYFKSDGKIQDSSFRTVGYIKKDGIVQDASFKTVGHADGIPPRWAAFLFFFL